MAADSSGAAAGDLVRSERSRRSDARILLVAPAGSEGAARQALDCGAIGVVERPIDAPALRQALAAAGCFDAPAPQPALEDEGHIALLGAGGGMGTTTCAVALGCRAPTCVRARSGAGDGDAAEVAAAHVAVPDAFLRSRAGPWPPRRNSRPGSPAAPRAGCSARRPARAGRSRRRERGIARILDLAVASGLHAIVDRGARVGVETIPVLERASLVAIVASTDARGARGARRVSLLLSRLGLSARLAGVVATGSRSRAPHRRWHCRPGSRCSRRSSRTLVLRAHASGECCHRRQHSTRSPLSREGAPREPLGSERN